MWSSKAALSLKKKIKNRELSLGYEQFLPCPNITEIAGIAGFDWVWLCTEHGTMGYGIELENCIRAAENVGMVPFVRITEPTAHFLYMKAFEAGAKGVIVPRIRTKADMEFAVKAAKWPGGPYRGEHGYCPGARRWRYGQVNVVDPYDYIDHDEAETFVIPILETVECMENLDEILSVKGVDFAMFGFADLGMTLGIRGRGEKKHDYGPKLIEEWKKKTIEACARHKIPLGQEFGSVEEAKRLIKEDGAHILMTNSDTGMLRIFWTNIVNGIRTADLRK